MAERRSTSSNAIINFLGGFFRRKRLLGTLFAVGTSLFLLNHFLDGGVSSLMGPTPSQPFDEFQGFLHYLTSSDKLLPARMEPLEQQDPDVWSYGASFTSSQWASKIARMHQEHPVIVFSKTYCPYSKKAKAILAEYPLKKQPVFIEADIRPDGPKVKALLTRLTGQGTFPNVIIGGKSIGGADKTEILHNSGKLRKKLKAAGAL